MTRNKSKLSLEESYFECIIEEDTSFTGVFELVHVFGKTTVPGFECKGTGFRSIGNISHIHLLINEVLSITSTARFSTILNLAPMRRSPMRMNNRNIPSTFPFGILPFAVWVI